MPKRPPRAVVPRAKQPPQRQVSARRRGYSADWERESKRFLRSHPICAICRRAPATCVDHIEPHKGNPVMFWARSNWQPACRSCNSAKAARSEGGFGNQRRWSARTAEGGTQ